MASQNIVARVPAIRQAGQRAVSAAVCTSSFAVAAGARRFTSVGKSSSATLASSTVRAIHSNAFALTGKTKDKESAASASTASSVAASSGCAVNFSIGAPESLKADALSVFLTSEQLTQLLTSASKQQSVTIEELLGAPAAIYAHAAPISTALFRDFKAAAGETLWVYPAADGSKKKAHSADSLPRLLLVGLGAANDVALSSYRSASWKAVSSFQSLLLKRVGIFLPTAPALDAQQRFFDSHYQNELVANVARIAILSEHYFRKYLSDAQIEKKKKKPFESLTFIDLAPHASSSASSASSTPTAASSAATAGKHGKKGAATVVTSASSHLQGHAAIIQTQQIIANATIRARELANERADVATPLHFENEARKIAKDQKLKITVLQEADLAKEGLNLLRAVGQAATHKARLVLLEYRGDSANKDEVTALVGKGITFDTGGLLIKGRGNMEGMHMDCSGAAAVLSTMSALPQLQVKANVVGVLALAENAVAAESYKPLAIIPTAQGSVEIQDTDAEGRLALVDAFTYVQKQHQPKQLIDLATLTGASVVALGEHVAALFANNDDMARAVFEASKKCGEQTWRMPILPVHAEELTSTYADMKNCTTHRWGGACIAAAFLEKFVNKGVNWIHLDIAGPAMISKAKEWQPEGGTGFGTQLLCQYFLQQDQQNSHSAATQAQPLGSEQIKQVLSQFKE